MVDPGSGGAMFAALVAGLAAGALLIAVAGRRLGARGRACATLLVAGALLLAALAAAGVPGDLLGPRSWDDLAAGINQGLAAVPNVRVPYHGVDEWTRTVLVLGGTALVALAALLAFVPRRGGAFGFPLAAAIALTTLYLVPVMQRDAPNQFWSGAVFTVLLLAFLRLERIERGTAPMAAGVVAAAVLAGLVFGPGLDRDGALLDYEGLAQTLSAGASQRYDWDHSYAPLEPREGREVLRVAARHRAYWKAANLEQFDGTRWLQGTAAQASALDGAVPREHPEWRQVLRVTFRSLTSSQFVAAGRTVFIDRSPRQPVESGSGVYVTAGRPLKRGNAYRAVVYTPSPTDAQLREAAGQGVPPDTDGTGLTAISLPAAARSVGPTTRIVIPAWGEGDPSPADVAAIESSPYAGVYALARKLRAAANTPFAYMRAVERHLRSGYTYSEDPPRSAVPLADFLLRGRRGYCQQFSGAMALLLRFGGVPARVAAGFAPGALDRARGEYVVRDMDAHSWVEVFFQGIGWVTRDPTPGDAPARSQTDDVASTGSGPATPLPDPIARRPERPAQADPGATSAEPGGGGAAPLPIAAIAFACALAAAMLLAVRRRRRGPAAPDDDGALALAELRCALRRSGRAPSPPTTLEALAERWRGTAAEAYVRGLAAARYGFGAASPTAAQRAALRRELARGGGWRGRARAWWALPPRPARR
jgi:transglutaminase-like putative cysteine protease